jgi:AcrR family transcriptional regulator
MGSASVNAQAGSAPQVSSRERILDASAEVFARRGYERASIDEIASVAGLSKGAVYWSFASKEQLFFALLDELDVRLRALMVPAGGEVDLDALSGELAGTLSAAKEVVLLFHEYSALAVRDPEVGARYAARNARLRADLADCFAAYYEAAGVELQLSPRDLASTVIALVDGLSVQQLTDPAAVSEDLFGQVLRLLDAGLSAARECP